MPQTNFNLLKGKYPSPDGITKVWVLFLFPFPLESYEILGVISFHPLSFTQVNTEMSQVWTFSVRNERDKIVTINNLMYNSVFENKIKLFRNEWGQAYKFSITIFIFHYDYWPVRFPITIFYLLRFQGTPLNLTLADRHSCWGTWVLIVKAVHDLCHSTWLEQALQSVH